MNKMRVFVTALATFVVALGAMGYVGVMDTPDNVLLKSILLPFFIVGIVVGGLFVGAIVSIIGMVVLVDLVGEDVVSGVMTGGVLAIFTFIGYAYLTGIFVH